MEIVDGMLKVPSGSEKYFFDIHLIRCNNGIFYELMQWQYVCSIVLVTLLLAMQGMAALRHSFGAANQQKINAEVYHVLPAFAWRYMHGDAKQVLEENR
ncbi:MAG TPA: hypothetical protein VNI77_07875 [Nitrososphaera sp.]|nr:hypothetical protein [Nitrososphaera sp.]